MEKKCSLTAAAFKIFIVFFFSCLCLSQSYRVLPELLQGLHFADRHGVQHLFPALLWPSCKQNLKNYELTVILGIMRNLLFVLCLLLIITCPFILWNSLLLPTTSFGSGWRWTRWWTSSRFLRSLCRCTWTGAGLVRMLRPQEPEPTPKSLQVVWLVQLSQLLVDLHRILAREAPLMLALHWKTTKKEVMWLRVEPLCWNFIILFFYLWG